MPGASAYVPPDDTGRERLTPAALFLPQKHVKKPRIKPMPPKPGVW